MRIRSRQLVSLWRGKSPAAASAVILSQDIKRTAARSLVILRLELGARKNILVDTLRSRVGSSITFQAPVFSPVGIWSINNTLGSRVRSRISQKKIAFDRSLVLFLMCRFGLNGRRQQLTAVWPC